MSLIVTTVLLISATLLYSQVPDTIVVKTTRVKGFGPFAPGTRTHLVTMDTSNRDPWPQTIPVIKGVPSDHADVLYRILFVDFYQYVYQNYHRGRIPEADYNDLKKQWGWEPTSIDYTKENVKLGIAVIARTDSAGNVVVKVDRNNNYDLSDDEWYVLPPILPGQSVQGRYNDLLPFEVAYQLYDGRQIRSCTSWFYVDYWSILKAKRVHGNRLELAYSFAEHHLGEFTFDGKEYTLALTGSEAAIRHDYNIKVWESENQETIPRGEGARENELVRLGDYYYRVTGTTLDGSEATLTRDGHVAATGGSQVGLKAPLFSARTITGEDFDLNSFKGKYVLLDFWGSWCGPCQEEMPKLRALHEKYKAHNFALIGIANDKIEPLVSYIKENGITWPQILQDSDHHILRLFNIQHYPSTFLIDPEGEIVAKDANADELGSTLRRALSR